MSQIEESDKEQDDTPTEDYIRPKKRISKFSGRKKEKSRKSIILSQLDTIKTNNKSINDTSRTHNYAEN